MRIRAIVAACGAASAVFSLSAASSPAEMQQPVKMYRVGILTAAAGSTETLRQSLRDLGYVEGRNVILEIRDTEGRPERANDLALQLARLKVDVIVATNPAAVFGAKRATATIPIVMMHTPDPVQLGLVASLARPGGNITGTTTLSVELSVKQLELLKEAVPRASRMALVWNPDNPWHPRVVKVLRDEHRLPGVQLQIVEGQTLRGLQRRVPGDDPRTRSRRPGPGRPDDVHVSESAGRPRGQASSALDGRTARLHGRGRPDVLLGG